tara:strand:- start:487 stop:1188 length:702 start_codon:yes stop_codon:yes gene_type:complete
MPIVKQNLWEEGDVPQAAELNGPYDGIATASTAIDQSNTRDNWITIKHFAAGKPCNELFDKVYDGTSQFSTNSTSYVTIDSAGGDPTECVLNYTTNNNEIIRVEASALVTNIDATKSFDTALPIGTRGDCNYYSFRLLLYYNTGAGTLTLSLGEWGYSFTSSCGEGRYYTANAGTIENTGVPLGFQTVQFSTVFRANSPGVNYEKIALQVQVNDAANIVKVSRNNIVVVRGRH